jgi:DNA-binding NarL/FixJ family response regulator
MASSDQVVSTVRVLTVDDQPTFHEAAHAVIAATVGFEWIGSASCGEEGVEQTERLRPDLVLMDVRMPGIGGVEAARRIASRGLPSVVVLVSAGDLPSELPGNTTSGIVSKRSFTRASLRHLWEDHR